MSDTTNPDTPSITLPQLDKFRFGVHKQGVGFSNMWFADQSGDNIYLGARAAKGSVKISLHASGICHVRGSGSLGLQTLSRWKRAATPSSGTVRVLSVDFPTDLTFRWRPMESLKPHQHAMIVTAPPPGHAVEFGFFYSREHPDAFAESKLNGTQIVYFDLPCGEYVSVVVRWLAFDPSRISPVGKSVTGIAHALPATGLENASMIAWTEPKDDCPLWVTNLQGIRVRRSSTSTA